MSAAPNPLKSTSMSRIHALSYDKLPFSSVSISEASDEESLRKPSSRVVIPHNEPRPVEISKLDFARVVKRDIITRPPNPNPEPHNNVEEAKQANNRNIESENRQEPARGRKFVDW